MERWRAGTAVRRMLPAIIPTRACRLPARACAKRRFGGASSRRGVELTGGPGGKTTLHAAMMGSAPVHPPACGALPRIARGDVERQPVPLLDRAADELGVVDEAARERSLQPIDGEHARKLAGHALERAARQDDRSVARGIVI